MKKISIIAVALLFSLVGFKYANAQSTMGGRLHTLSLNVTFKADEPQTSTHTEGSKLVTAKSGLNKSVKGVMTYDPVLYFSFDSNNQLAKIIFDWLSPSTNDPNVLAGTRIYTIHCTGGNTFTPVPGLPKPLDGMITSDPQLPTHNTPSTHSSSFEGVATCYFCPDGFKDPGADPSPGVCNDGSSYGQGYLIYKGTASGLPTGGSGLPTSISVSGEVGGSGFIYLGDYWASADYTGANTPKALFYGTFSATLTPCSDSTCSNL